MINVHNPIGGCRLVRSPSRDSMTTQASIGSVLDYSGPSTNNKPPSHLRVSFRAKPDCQNQGTGSSSRGPSPLPCHHRLSVPSGSGSVRPRPSSARSDLSRSAQDRHDVWLDEGNDLIRSCGALSKVLGLQKSFSCGDILNLMDPVTLTHSRSESWLVLADCEYNWGWGKLDVNSRSLSTWVAVGDTDDTTNSQLPSPHVELIKGFPCCDQNNQWTTADLIRSVNKKVRHNYIRKRLKVTYKALEQLSQSGFDLMKVEALVRKTRHSQNLESLLVSGVTPAGDSGASGTGSGTGTKAAAQPCPIETVTRDLVRKDAKLKTVSVVSPKEIAKDQGKPLSKYERNMMIFDWLHTLDEYATVTGQETVGDAEKDTLQEAALE